jgi:hypothetical protein
MVFYAFANGFLRGHTDAMKAERAALREQQKADKEADEKLGETVFDLIKNDKLTGPEGAAFLSLPSGQKNMANLASLVSQTADVAMTQRYGSGNNAFKLNLVSEMKYGSGTSNYDRSQIFWDSWQKQLADENNYNTALNYFKSNKDAADALRADVLKNEYEIRMGNILRQKKQGVEAVGMQFIDLGSDYSNAARLFDELGFQSVEQEAINQAATHIQDLDTETQTAFWMNTKNKDGGGVEQAVAISVDKATATIWEQMAAAGGFADAQEMIFSYNYDPTIVREEGETDQQFAAKQNALLYKTAELEKDNSWGVYLRSPSMWDKEKSARLLMDLDETFGANNKTAQIQALSLLSGTPSGVFSKTRKYRYQRDNNQGAVSQMTGLQLVEMVTKLKKDDFDNGLKAQEDAVSYIERLEQLEVELGQQAGTGWVRDFAAGFKAFGIQIKQGVSLIGDVFNDNAELFQGGDLGAIQAAAAATGIDLAAVSEAEAIRLTLAAKMARAVDPAGRLSNQDFEIQLRRLGSYKLSTPQSIAAALKVVKKEFMADLEYKQMLSNIAEQITPLTRQQARRVQAAMSLRKLQGYVYGTGRVTQKPPTSEQPGSPEGGLPQGAVAMPDMVGPNGETVFYKDGVYYDENGNVVTGVTERGIQSSVAPSVASEQVV